MFRNPKGKGCNVKVEKFPQNFLPWSQVAQGNGN